MIGIVFNARGEEYRNPFYPLLPEEEEKEQEMKNLPEVSENMPELSVNIEGIIWGDNVLKQVIIDGEIYQEGDSLKGYQAKIVKIENDKVKILYKGRILEFTPTKKKK